MNATTAKSTSTVSSRINSDNPQLKKLDRLAWLLDSSITIPGTSWRIGLDGIIGMIPGIGDVTSGALSGYIVVKAMQMGVGPIIIARMMLNILLEVIVGAIPVVGDIFDFIFKANQRNVSLMQHYLLAPDTVQKRSAIQLLISALIIIASLVLIIYLIVKIIGWLLGAIF